MKAAIKAINYYLPTTACLLQERLGIPQTAGALDFNLGCSGFIYGLGLAVGLIETSHSTTIPPTFGGFPTRKSGAQLIYDTNPSC